MGVYQDMALAPNHASGDVIAPLPSIARSSAGLRTTGPGRQPRRLPGREPCADEHAAAAAAENFYDLVVEVAIAAEADPRRHGGSLPLA